MIPSHLFCLNQGLDQQEEIFQAMTSKKDHITVDGIKKIKGLEAEDKYKVLEFLVKEMLEIKESRLREYYRD